MSNHKWYYARVYSKLACEAESFEIQRTNILIKLARITPLDKIFFLAKSTKQYRSARHLGNARNI